MSLILGFYAAVAWAFHDLFVRHITQKTPILPMLFFVLLFGTFLLSPTVFLSSDRSMATLPAICLSVASGVIFAFSSLSLYAAFSIGPVKLVAPIISAFPVVSVGWAVLNGSLISSAQWGAVLLVVCGVALVATLSDTSQGSIQKHRAILYSALASIGFAATFATSQAATLVWDDSMVIFTARTSATITIGILIFAVKSTWMLPKNIWLRLGMLGFLDASALAMVTRAGTMPHPEFAAVSSSLFGMLTVILARVFLREYMTRAQWIAVIIVFCGIGILGY